MSYALYKFHKAILSLDGTDLSKKQWLASSYMHHIIHLRDIDLPDLVREDFHQLRSRLTRTHAVGTLATLEKSIEDMEDSEVENVIDSIMIIYKSIWQYERQSVLT